ncbi:MAG: UDP-N-acetylmuramoyl-L-alanyl-D-glutamate--2,6-diaminopimelate ligase [Bacteroidota bacterium]
MKHLKDILHKVDIIDVIGIIDVTIKGICFDNRHATKGSLFVATTGKIHDGHKFIDAAIDFGAIVIVCEYLPINLREGITYLLVRSSSIALGFISSNYFDNPSEKLKVIGVTGTNGKTTVTTLLFQLYINLGYKVGLISTINNKINDEVIPSSHTTPDAIQINKLMKKMVDKGCNFCFMEVSSHAIDQNRIAGLCFTGGIFTNITHDHLDYHKTFKAYLEAKKTFFDLLNTGAFALTNNDDKNGMYMLQNTKALKKNYSIKSMSDFKGKIIENQFDGLLLNIDNLEVHCKLVGRFNAYNLMAVYAVSILLGEDKIKTLTELSKINPAEGRFDFIQTEQNKIGIVDYAHTPDALENILKTINEIKNEKSKLISVIGCGGDRDKDKRPIMAKITSELSNTIILTSDNPRSEEPEEIIKHMKNGIEPAYLKNTLSIIDRVEAIRTACKLSNDGDIILVAGKGHEKYQEIKGVKYPMDDKKILMESILEIN